MPASSLRCRACGTAHTADTLGPCTRCFGPLDPVYDWEQAADPRVDRGRPAVDLALRRPAPGHRADRRRAWHPASPRSSPRPRLAEQLGDRRALPQARHGQPDPLLQGPGRRGRGPQGPGARLHHARVLVDGEPRQRGRRARGRGGARRGRVLPGRPRAGEAARDRASTAPRSTRSTAPTTTARGSRSSSRGSCRGASSTSTCARSTRRGRRRSPSRSPSSSAGSSPTR